MFATDSAQGPSPRGHRPQGGSASHLKEGEMAILALYDSGESEAGCSLLHQTYWGAICAIARRRLGAFFAHDGLNEQVEDVAMTALNAIHLSLEQRAKDGRLQGLRSLKGWIRRVVQNKAYDAMEARTRRGAEILSRDGASHQPEDISDGWSEARVVDMLDGDARIQDLRLCVANVGERPGQALRLWLGGRSLTDVAKALAYRSVSGAQSALGVAFERVKRCMGKKGHLGEALSNG